MATYEITCITKSGPQNEHITHVGKMPSCPSLSVAEVIKRIKSGDQFIVTDKRTGKKAIVGIYKEVFIRTHADNTWNDNLLSLPAC